MYVNYVNEILNNNILYNIKIYIFKLFLIKGNSISFCVPALVYSPWQVIWAQMPNE